MSSTATVAPGFTASTAFLTASFSASVSCSGFATTVLSAGVFTLFPAFGSAASASVFTKSAAGIVAVVPSFRVTVAFPFLSNTTFSAFGFTALIASVTLALSASVKASGSFTTTLSAGVFTLFPAFGLAASASVFTKSVAGIVADLPSFNVTVAFPLSSTNTALASGFTAFTLASIAFFSSGVRASGFATTVLSAGLLMLFPAFSLAASASVFTKSSFGMTTVLPSLVVTVAFPLSSTNTVVPSAGGLTSLTLAVIASFSSCVNESGFFTKVLSAGFLTASCLAGSCKSAFGLTKSAAGIVAMLPSLVLTVAFPLSSNTTSAPGFTSLIFFSTSSSSLAVNLAGSFTNTLSAGVFTLLPAFAVFLSASVFTKSFTGIVAVCPSGVVTVAFPFSSTYTDAPGLTSATLSLIALISSGVKLSLSVTNSLSAGLLITLPAFGSVNTSSSVFTKSSAGITAVFPSGVVTVAFPFSSTYTDAPGLTSLTLSAIAFFSSGVKASLSATTVSSIGFLTASCLAAFSKSSLAFDFTKSEAGIVAVLPSGVVTVAFPLSSTTTFAPGFTDSTAF